jgi:hypothetical protein
MAFSSMFQQHLCHFWRYWLDWPVNLLLLPFRHHFTRHHRRSGRPQNSPRSLIRSLRPAGITGAAPRAVVVNDGRTGAITDWLVEPLIPAAPVIVPTLPALQPARPEGLALPTTAA